MRQMGIGHYYNYRMIGPDLNGVGSGWTQIYRSAFDPVAASIMNVEIDVVGFIE